MPFDISDQFSKEPLTAEQRQEIPNYTLELTQHVAIKGIQAGALIGTVIGSALLLRSRPLTWADGVVRVGRTAAMSSGVTAVASVAAMAVLMQREGWNDYRIWDRAYRLRHNSFQQRCDRFSAIAAASTAALLQLPPFGTMFVPRATLALAGAALGVGLGVLAHVATMPGEDPSMAVKSGVKAVETVGKRSSNPTRHYSKNRCE